MNDVAAFVVAVLGSSVISALITQGWTFFADREKGAKAARYLALRLAIILESYALDCTDAIGIHEIENAGISLPKLPEYPDEESWKWFDPTLLERSLSFRHEISLSQQATYHVWQIEGAGETDEETKDQCGKCGWMAWRLACDLRKFYDLAAFKPENTAWSFADHLEPLHDAVLKKARDPGGGGGPV